MADENSPEPGTHHNSTLQRGKACLRCRKRKMRCDGAKPACTQCSKAKKSDSCEYDDGKGKTRTQILRDSIARLEQRVRELEDPEYIPPSVTLHNPHMQSRSESSSSGFSFSDSPPDTSLGHSPYLSDSSSPSGSWGQLPVSPAATATAFTQHLKVEQGRHSLSPSPLSFSSASTAPLPFEMSLVLLDIFQPHQSQSGLKTSIGRLRESLSMPNAPQRHPVLLNAIFLWACYMTRPGPLSADEPHYLARSVESMSDALQYPEHMLDIIQASCLLSMYFLSNGRFHEGSYHASVAASLTVQCGLNGAPATQGLFNSNDPTFSFRLAPPKDRVEEGERILTFWQVYNLDRCWSVVLHKPLVIQDMQNSFGSVNVPWPLEVEDYASGQLDEGYGFQTVRSFFEGQSNGGFSVSAQRAKASTLLERTDRLAALMDPTLTPAAVFSQNLAAMEGTVNRFIATLVPVHQLDAASPDDKRTLLVVHTLAQTALIHLFFRAALTDAGAYEKCLRAAQTCVTVIKHLSDMDFEYLDPIMGPCWTAVSDTLIRELDNIENSWTLMAGSDARADLGTLLYALTSLNAKFPLVGFTTAKVQDRLSDGI